MQIVLNKDKTEATIIVPWSKDGIPSKRRNKNKVVLAGDGKSFLHASDNGRTVIDEREVKFGLNIYSPNDKYVQPTDAEEAVKPG